MNIRLKTKVYEKNVQNVLYQRILLEGLSASYDFLLLRYVKCKILLIHTCTTILASTKIFTRSKSKVFDKNLIHQRIS